MYSKQTSVDDSKDKTLQASKPGSDPSGSLTLFVKTGNAGSAETTTVGSNSKIALVKNMIAKAKSFIKDKLKRGKKDDKSNAGVPEAEAQIPA